MRFMFSEFLDIEHLWKHELSFTCSCWTIKPGGKVVCLNSEAFAI